MIREAHHFVFTGETRTHGQQQFRSPCPVEAARQFVGVELARAVRHRERRDDVVRDLFQNLVALTRPVRKPANAPNAHK
jgi:hypothetical protein